ncbi:MAG: lipid IV(A) 3-deoxy-D-manno-octulosonic acid transferase [Gammaproteobacteria bacterium]
MLRQVYSLLLLLATPLIVLRLYFKSVAAPSYRRRIGERFAAFSLPTQWGSAKKTLWIHAVSVGEVVAAAPLVRALLKNAEFNILMTTTTPTGAERVGALFGDTVHHVYAPYDLGFVIRKFLARVKPELLIIMETELWPNTVHFANRQGVKILLANARLSEKSARGYQRVSSMTRPLLQSIDIIAAQAEADRRRFIDLGADEKSTVVTGSLKFNIDITADKKSSEPFFIAAGNLDRLIVIAASTREGEEARVLDAWNILTGDVHKPLLILVPRHPERFASVAELCRSQGWAVQRRSESDSIAADTDIVIGDSMGEMLAYYGLADIAFVGGSLVDTGCQNVLEPAALGVPVVVGPSQFNFEAICQQLESAGALVTVQDSSALATTLSKLLADPDERKKMGLAGQALVAENQQALPRLLELIHELG